MVMLLVILSFDYDIFSFIGSYNNFFRMFERSGRKEVTFEASREIAKPKTMLKPRKVSIYWRRI